jgi:hypothetical protein
MRYSALTNILATSLATSPADSLHSSHSSQGTARVQKLRSAVMRAPMSTSSPESMSTDEPSSRRRALQSILFGGSVAFMAPVGARALDMEAFVNSQVRHVAHQCMQRQVKELTLTHTLFVFFIHYFSSKRIPPIATPKRIPNVFPSSTRTKPCASTDRVDKLEVKPVSGSRKPVDH